MALTWGDISTWAPAGLDTAETDLRKARRAMLDLADELETMGLPRRWHGDASDTSRTRLKNVSHDLKDVVAEVSAAYTAVCDAADAVRGVELAVDAAKEHATLHALSIAADGTVTDVGNPIDTGNAHDDEVARDERHGWVTECVDRIEQALRKAEDVDADLASVLERIELDRIHVRRGGLAEAARVGETQGDLGLLAPPQGATPSDSTAWWATLSPAERRQVIARYPHWIGSRDGVDFTSRDLANRNLLADRREYVENRLADPNLSDDEREDLEEEQAALASIDAMLSREGVHQLAGLDFSKGRTEAIVVNGNLDEADHVAVFTPGMTSNVPGMGGYDGDMADLRRRILDALERQGVEDPQVATVTWLGYQAPQALPDLSVVSSSAAEQGGKDLASFFRGINTSARNDPHLTALGHSYGSTTTGYALQHDGTGVDHTVLFGSPGAASDDIDDYRTPTGSTYYAEASNDLVGDMSRFGADPSGMDGVRELETGDAEDADGNHLESSRGHSEYLVDGTTTQYSIAEVATGSSDGAVTEDDDQGFWDSRLDDLTDELDKAKDDAADTLEEEWEAQKENIEQGVEGVRKLGGWLKDKVT